MQPLSNVNQLITSPPFFFNELARFGQFWKHALFGSPFWWRGSPLVSHLTKHCNIGPHFKKLGFPWHVASRNAESFLIGNQNIQKVWVTTASLARGGCAEVGVTASAKSASANQDGPVKLAIARLVVSRKLDGWYESSFQESTEPCKVKGGPFGGVYDGLICAGHGTCK